MRPLIIPVILARMDSTRLPGKVIRPILNGESVLEVIVDSVASLRSDTRHDIRQPILATTSRACDDVISDSAPVNGLEIERGDLLPLRRLHAIAKRYPGAWLWRLNADSPIILNSLVSKGIDAVSGKDDLDAVTNIGERSFPYGVSLELFRCDFIASLNLSCLNTATLEHVSPILGSIPHNRWKNITTDTLSIGTYDADVRLTIDTEDDEAFFRAVFESDLLTGTAIGSVERMDFVYNLRK